MNKVTLPAQPIRRFIPTGIPVWVLGGSLVFAVLVLIAHLRLSAYAYDDAFIHFRVVRNLFDFGAPYYNPGEVVKVSTSSGWILFLAIFFGIARLLNIESSFPFMVSLLNASTTLAAAVVYTSILRRLLQERISLRMQASVFLSVTALLLPASIGLMETPLALLAAGAGILLLTQDRLAGFILLGFMVFLRLELVVLLGLAGLFFFLQRPSRLIRIAGYSTLGMLLPLIFDLVFYHTLVPQSLLAKAVVYERSWAEPALETLVTIFPFLGIRGSTFYLLLAVVALTAVILTTTVSMLLWITRKNYWPLLMTFWSLLVMGAYVIGQALVFEWYTPLYAVPMLAASGLAAWTAHQPRTLVLRGFLLLLFLASGFSLGRTLYASLGQPVVYPHFELGSRVKSYQMIGALLQEEYPQARLLTSEIGGLGFTFKGQILDAAGLASPQAMAYHPLLVPEERASGNVGAIPPEYVLVTRPEIIVSYDALAQALLESEVSQWYHMILIPAYLPEDEVFARSKEIWGSQYLRVYIRKDLPISEKLMRLGQ